MAPVRKKQKLSDEDVAIADDALHSEFIEKDKTSGTSKDSRRSSLFVRSLPATTTSDSLTSLFSESYPIKHATAVTDPATKQCRGYGFVTFADADDAQRAKEEFNGHLLEGRRMRVEIAEPRHRDAETGEPDVTAKQTMIRTQKEIPQPSRLIVRNLPWTVKTSEQLSKMFMSYGKIKQAYIPKATTGRMAGFGFVVFRGRKNAEKALEGINGKEIDGRMLAVDWAVSKGVYEDLLKGGSVYAAVESDPGLAQDSQHEEEMPNAPGNTGSEDDILDADDDGGADEPEDEAEDDGKDAAEDAAGEPEEAEDREAGDVDRSEDRSSTLFVRNLPFTCTDEELEDHFTGFGSTRYARVVLDPGTGRSRGTGFVCFYNKADADACLRDAPRKVAFTTPDSKDTKTTHLPSSILQNEDADRSGKYTLQGRVLQLSRAVNKSEASRLTQEGVDVRHKRNQDKRRVYLLSEGTISSKSKLWEQLSPSERTMREASAKQRKSLIESNPSLHLSLTRLSVRNIPRSIGSMELKALAREAMVGFAKDVKAGSRMKISKEELARGGEDMELAEKHRKKTGKGVVRQAKVVFEGAGGSKTSEDSGAGRSRGYGFIEYYTHRSALMGLRWLNGHAIGYQVTDPKKAGADKADVQDRKKRLIVEFAIENVQVVMRRKDREQKAREWSEAVRKGTATKEQADAQQPGNDAAARNIDTRKRKRGPDNSSKSPRAPGRKQDGVARRQSGKQGTGPPKSGDLPKKPLDEKLARRNQIIGRKRAVRQKRSGAKA